MIPLPQQAIEKESREGREKETERITMKCPKCGTADAIGVDITISKVLRLAKGGGVTTAGTTVTQADLKHIHESAILEWTSPRGRVERYYEVRCTNEGDPDTGEGFCCHKFWYFPARIEESGETKPGRGLTWVGGRDLSQPEPVEGEAPAGMDPSEGDIPADEGGEVVEEAPAPVVAKPVTVAPAKPAVAIPAKAPIAIRPVIKVAARAAG